MAVPTYVSHNGSEGNAINSPGNWPAATQNNDIMVIWLSLSNTTTPVLPSAPTGYTLLFTSNQIGSTAATTILSAVYWKRVGASEAAPTFSGITGQRFFSVDQIRGCVTSGSPFDISGVESDIDPAGTSISLDIGSTAVTDCLILYHIASSIGTSNTFSSGANSNLGSVTEQYDVGAGESTMGVYTGTLAAGGAVGTFTATQGSALSMTVGFALKSTTSTALTTPKNEITLMGVGR